MSFYTTAHPQVWNESDNLYITCMNVRKYEMKVFLFLFLSISTVLRLKHTCPSITEGICSTYQEGPCKSIFNIFNYICNTKRGPVKLFSIFLITFVRYRPLFFTHFFIVFVKEVYLPFGPGKREMMKWSQPERRNHGDHLVNHKNQKCQQQ